MKNAVGARHFPTLPGPKASEGTQFVESCMRGIRDDTAPRPEPGIFVAPWYGSAAMRKTDRARTTGCVGGPAKGCGVISSTMVKWNLWASGQRLDAALPHAEIPCSRSPLETISELTSSHLSPGPSLEALQHGCGSFAQSPRAAGADTCGWSTYIA